MHVMCILPIVIINTHMRISELTGVKSRSEYKAAADSSAMHILAKRLNSLGYEEYSIGSGYYSHVYARPDDPYVIKIYHDDPGYQHFLSFIREYPNDQHLPKVKLSVKLPGSFRLIRIERLAPSSVHVSSMIYDFTTLYKKIKIISREYDSDSSYIRSRLEGFSKLIAVEFPSLVGTLKRIVDYADSYNLDMDIHPGNIMMRGNIPVIIDPFVGS